ncbi:MAG: transporter substrate-binding domain-containing protein [Oscillatoria princeps RMCB-10]|nr:transporter substrate-binding domain-containing protein [Oscillatoria princeps RMCB-10]
MGKHPTNSSLLPWAGTGAPPPERGSLSPPPRVRGGGWGVGFIPGICNTRFLIALAIALLPVAAPLIAPAPAPAAELKQIHKRGRLIVAVKDNVRPLGFTDATGKLQGLEVDIARRLAEELLGSPDAVELRPVANQDRLSVLLDGKVDITIARVTATESRSRLVDFSIPYYMDGTGFVTKDGSVRRLEEVGRSTIATLNNSDTIANVKYFLPNAKLVGADSYEAGRTLIETGAAGAFAADASVLAGWVQEYPEYRILPVLLTAEPLCVVMPKGLQHAELRLRVNQAIGRWKTEGWLQERIKYWGLPVPDEQTSPLTPNP